MTPKFSFEQLDMIVKEQIEFWFWYRSKTDGNRMNDMLQRKSPDILKEEMRKLFYETIENKRTVEIDSIRNYPDRIHATNLVGEDLSGKDNYIGVGIDLPIIIKSVGLIFDKDDYMNLTEHIRRIERFVFTRHVCEPILESSRGMKYKTEKERHRTLPNGQKIIEFDMYGIAQTLGESYSRDLFYLNRDIRNWDKKK